MDSENTPKPVEIPVSSIDRETLTDIVEQFVLREGTDYGAVEVTLSKKVEQILKQLDKGDTKLYFDPESESVTLIKAR